MPVNLAVRLNLSSVSYLKANLGFVKCQIKPIIYVSHGREILSR